MSVESTFYLVDWKHLQDLHSRAEDLEYLTSALENEEPWIEAVEPTGEVDAYGYESWRGKIAFSDWYRDHRGDFPAEAELKLHRVLGDLGFVTDATDGFRPVQELTEEEDEWVFAALPPVDVRRLHEEFRTLDLDSFDLDAAFDGEALPFLEDAEALRKYLEGFGHLLAKARDKGRGILVLAA